MAPPRSIPPLTAPLGPQTTTGTGITAGGVPGVLPEILAAAGTAAAAPPPLPETAETGPAPLSQDTLAQDLTQDSVFVRAADDGVQTGSSDALSLYMSGTDGGVGEDAFFSFGATSDGFAARAPDEADTGAARYAFTEARSFEANTGTLTGTDSVSVRSEPVRLTDVAGAEDGGQAFAGFSSQGQVFAPIAIHDPNCPCSACGEANGETGASGAAADGGDAPPQESTPTSSFTISAVSNTGTNAIDSLLSGVRWGAGDGSTVNMTFSFGTSSSVYLSGYSEPSNGFAELADSQKTAVRSALQYWSDVANITFTEVTDSSTVAGDLRFAKSSDPSTAWAYYPSSSAKGGDVWIGPSSNYNNMSEGTYGFQTLLHEIGHALGLSHTHQGGTVATSDIDWTGYSVMSYRSYAGAPLNGYTQAYYPTTPMINDIQAIQYMYGANTSYNSGNTTYSWTTGANILETIWDSGGTDTIDWSNQSSAAVINLTSGVWSQVGPSYIASYSQWPYTYESRTLMIAEDTVIENAVGGSGNDTIAGNAADNVLTGGAGSDALTGNGGADRFVFASGFGADTISDFTVGTDKLDFTSYGYSTYAQVLSSISFADVSGNAVLTIGSDSVTLTGVTISQLSVDDFYGVIAGATAGDDTLTCTTGNDAVDGLGGNDTISGGAGNDVLRGGSGDDTLNGDAGNDTLFGDAGDDTLNGGAGDDVLRGGAGRDVFAFSSGFGNDTIHDFTVGFDSIDLSGLGISSYTDLLAATADVSGNATITIGTNTITLTGVTKSSLQQGDFVGISPVGTSGADTLTGWDTDDTIDGLGGNDTIYGGAGADTLSGGEGNDRIDGGTGADSMAGGAGDDTYVVDNASDTVTENSSEGNDTVEASVTYTLASNVENLTLTGSGNIDGTGNSGSNTLRGNSGNNVLTGNGGSDSLFGEGGDDTLTGGSAFDALIGGAGNDTIYGGGGNDWIRGEADNDTLYGEAGNDKMYGEAGNDTLDGGTGNDYMVGGTGDDIYVVDSAGDVVVEASGEGTDTVQSSATYTVLADNVENLTLTGTANIDGTGNSLDNTITGNSGDNVLIGGGGNDTLIGGEGSDTYIISDNTDTIVEGTAASGTDTVIASMTYSIASDFGIENLTLSTSGNFDATGNMFDNVLTGNSGDNTLTGGNGNDTLDGGTGTDILIGGIGDDTYYIVDALDTITENSGEGTDTVLAWRDYTLGSNLENLTLSGASHINGTGNTLDNTITGNSARNRIDGGAGADTMAGGDGDDTYVVDDVGDTVTESAGQGTDSVESSVTFTLSANVENLKLTGTSDINGTGNNSANFVQGNSGANTLSSGAGDDTIFGYGGDDTIYGGTGADSLYGDAGSDTIDGGTGNDQIRGGSGRDTFVFSSSFGNDTIHDFTVGFDSIDLTALGIGNYSTLLSGTADSGSDTVITIGANSITLKGVLKAQLQESDFVGLTPEATTGNDTLNGLETADTIDGLGGNDTIYGNGGADILSGGAGDDYIDGGAGADTMSGGTGNDTFVVNHASDSVTENAGEGTDTILSSTGWTLGSNIENLTLTGTLNINGYGNSDSNTIIGNSGNNILTGNGGNDTILGMAGNDTITGGSSWDSLLGGTGDDTIYGGDGNDWIRGEEDNDTLYGQGGRDRLYGEAGNDYLDGGASNDFMYGGTGDDTYVVDNASDVVSENASEGTDTVNSYINYTLGSNVENLTLLGTGNLSASGNSLDNTITGNSGSNTIWGGDGADTLTGGSSSDTFDFNALSEIGDTITDFEVGASGDVLDFVGILSDVGYGGADPLGDTRVRLQQSGADTLVQIDTDGGGNYATVVTLQNITSGDLTTDNWLFS